MKSLLISLLPVLRVVSVSHAAERTQDQIMMNVILHQNSSTQSCAQFVCRVSGYPATVDLTQVTKKCVYNQWTAVITVPLGSKQIEVIRRSNCAENMEVPPDYRFNPRIGISN